MGDLTRRFAMNRISKIMTGAATAALVTLTAAAPASAQYRDYDRNYDNGIGTGDIIRGVAIAGAAAAAIGALRNVMGGGGAYGYPQGRYGYPQGGYGYPQGGSYPQQGAYGNNYGYGVDYAVNTCGQQAQRYGGRVSVTDVDRKGSRSFRVRGVIDGANNGYDRNYGYGNRYGYNQRISFKCDAREDGRITDFDVKRG